MVRQKHVHGRARIPFARELRLLVSGVGLFFLTLSLFTYHAHDSSWFYASTDASPLHNKGGAVGALLSAFFFYVFGLAAFIVLGMLFFLFYCALTQRSWKSDWERVGAFCLLSCVCAALCNAHGIDWPGAAYAGGIVGHGVQSMLSYFFDELVTILFLYASVMICLVLIFRVSWISLAHLLARCVRWVSRMLVSKERLWAPAYRASKKVAHGVSYPFVHAARAIWVIRVISSWQSRPAVIIRSANSSITTTI
jgi:DNA segregation ATPase FtsK/SpoIIIE-like protein